jgi:hypothetical protein
LVSRNYWWRKREWFQEKSGCGKVKVWMRDGEIKIRINPFWRSSIELLLRVQ